MVTGVVPLVDGHRPPLQTLCYSCASVTRRMFFNYLVISYWPTLPRATFVLFRAQSLHNCVVGVQVRQLASGDRRLQRGIRAPRTPGTSFECQRPTRMVHVVASVVRTPPYHAPRI